MISVLGLAGSGKSTQGKLLAKKLNCPWISMSQLLHEKGGPQVRQQMLEGKIIDDSITLAILEEDLNKKEAQRKECVIDGWPRVLAQAEWLAGKARQNKIMMTGVIHLKADPSVAEQRILERGRADDTPEAIARRFNDYIQTILPILDYLKGQGIKVFDIDGDESVEVVEQRIDTALGVK